MEKQDSTDARTPPNPFRDILVEARRRRLNRVLSAVLLGCVLAAYTLGALGQRVITEDQNDLLPAPLEALLLGAAFAVGSLPVAWSIIGRILLPMPTFFLYFTVLIGKEAPLPFYAAFSMAVVYSAALTALARQLADHPTRPALGSRHPGAGSS
jgi:Na+-transporting NADH:ubiquinone oxidoreductase subunit NqrB